MKSHMADLSWATLRHCKAADASWPCVIQAEACSNLLGHDLSFQSAAHPKSISPLVFQYTINTPLIPKQCGPGTTTDLKKWALNTHFTKTEMKPI